MSNVKSDSVDMVSDVFNDLLDNMDSLLSWQVFDQFLHDLDVDLWFWMEFLQDNSLLDNLLGFNDLLVDDLLSLLNLLDQFLDDLLGDLLSLGSLNLLDQFLDNLLSFLSSLLGLLVVFNSSLLDFLDHLLDDLDNLLVGDLLSNNLLLKDLLDLLQILFSLLQSLLDLLDDLLWSLLLKDLLDLFDKFLDDDLLLVDLSLNVFDDLLQVVNDDLGDMNDWVN